MSVDNRSGEHSIGGFSRLTYDTCAYKQTLHESVSPMGYRMEKYMYESPSPCTESGKYYAPFDLVDQESELKNITRQSTRCPSKHYSATCKWVDGNQSCTNTFDKKFPVIYSSDMCPIVHNNIKKQTTPGFSQ